MYKYILFDFDGTLFDTSEGILNAAKYGLEQCGIYETNIDKLKQFIGPPLKDAFVQLYGMTEEDAGVAVKYFREYYNRQGKFECCVYPGIEAMLQELKNDGVFVAVATSKPTKFATEILAGCSMQHYFNAIVGSNMDNTRSKKCEVIQYILSNYSILDKSQVVMIGDKSHDLIGAQQCGISAIGVTYGFGTIDELQQIQHDVILSSVEELNCYLRGK